MPEVFVPKPPAVLAAEAPPSQTDPAKPGYSTSEFQLVLGVIVAVIAGSTAVLTQLQTLFPGNQAIAGIATVVGAMAGVVALAMKYAGGRQSLKAALLHSDNVAMLADAGQLAGTVVLPPK